MGLKGHGVGVVDPAARLLVQPLRAGAPPAGRQRRGGVAAQQRVSGGGKLGKWTFTGEVSQGDFAGSQKYFSHRVKQRYEISPGKGEMGSYFSPPEAGRRARPGPPPPGARVWEAAKGSQIKGKMGPK